MKRCDEECKDGCWACVKGWVEIGMNEAEVIDEKLHVIHNDL